MFSSELPIFTSKSISNDFEKNSQYKSLIITIEITNIESNSFMNYH